MDLRHRLAVFGKFRRHAVDAGRVIGEATRPAAWQAAAVAGNALFGTGAARIFRFYITRARGRGRWRAFAVRVAHRCRRVGVDFNSSPRSRALIS